jgi:hypothetical protein
MKPKFYDCLKYWKVIRQWVKSRYNLNQADLDMLLFLYTEEYFTRSKFEEFDNIMTWDKKRFHRLMNDGWIEKFRDKSIAQTALYTTSYKCKRMIYNIYEKMSGEDIPENKTNSPLFARNVGFADKVYRNFIIGMNKERRKVRLQEQRPSPEL